MQVSENMKSFPEIKQVLQTLLRTERSKRIRQSEVNTLAGSDEASATH